MLALALLALGLALVHMSLKVKMGDIYMYRLMLHTSNLAKEKQTIDYLKHKPSKSECENKYQ